jgi:vacuolar-type H+-ATPase subunit F/Vma7
VTSRVQLVATGASASGWLLAGLPVYEAVSLADGAARVALLAESGTPDVVLVEQSIYDALDPEQRTALSRRPLPLVVPYPGPAWAGDVTEAHAVIAELLRQAIGYRVRLR